VAVTSATFLAFFLLFFAVDTQQYWDNQGRQCVPLISLSFLDVYGYTYTINIVNEWKNAYRISIDTSRVMLQILASLTDDSIGIICDCNMFIVQAIGRTLIEHCL